MRINYNLKQNILNYDIYIYIYIYSFSYIKSDYYIFSQKNKFLIFLKWD
jgi:hypothetical protein